MDGVRKYSDTAEMSAEQQARIIETLTEQIETEEMTDKRLALILEFWAVCPWCTGQHTRRQSASWPASREGGLRTMWLRG